MRRIVIGIVWLLLAMPAWAQPEVDAIRVYLGTSGSTCTLHSGSGAPSTSLGAVCDVYVRTDSPYTVYSKTGASTWTPLPTMPSGATAGDLITAASATATGRVAAVAAGQVLASAGTSTPPSYTASPSLTSIGGVANLTLNPTGDLITAPTGDDILPDTGYTLNIGALTNKYLTLHAAELWVETLVAQNTIATIGGRVLVGPTTTLTSDLASGATSMSVKHNQMANGDRVYLEANGKVEFIAIASAPSGNGPYTYTITRNLDGTGANDWYAGDAVFNTGTTGDGFIDLYSVSAVNGPSVLGPSIVGNVRTGTTYSDIAPRWAIGNLNGVYGYGADTYGAAFGDFSNSYLTVDATNGIRMIGDAGTMFSMDTAGNATFAGQITVGTARNWLSNTEFRLETFAGSTAADGPATGIAGTRVPAGAGGTNGKWRSGFYSGTGSPTWGWYCNTLGGGNANNFPAGSGACSIFTTGTPSAASTKDVYGPSFAASAGQRFELSFYAEQYGAGITSVCPAIFFYSSSETFLSQSSGETCSTTVYSATAPNTLDEWGRGYVLATAPANTAHALVVIRAHLTNGSQAGYDFTRVFFGQVPLGQTQPSPWAPGGITTIDGSQLATDLVIANTLRSSGATALGTGTGFWLDATSTPTFRVGNPSGNQVKWDGTDITVISDNFTADGSGVSIVAPTYGSFDNPNDPNAYRFTATNYAMGVYGQVDGVNGSYVALSNTWTTTGSRSVYTILLADNPTAATSAQIMALADSGGDSISLNTSKVFINSIQTDGTGKTVCVKSDQSLGTCTTQPNSSGVCTCS